MPKRETAFQESIRSRLAPSDVVQGQMKMPFEVEHLRGIEEVKLRFTWRDEDGQLRKKGVIIEVTPDDLPDIEENMKYPRVFLSRETIFRQRV
jgi:hypothetical protein